MADDFQALPPELSAGNGLAPVDAWPHNRYAAVNFRVPEQEWSRSGSVVAVLAVLFVFVWAYFALEAMCSL